jgi:hypothetical protein
MEVHRNPDWLYVDVPMAISWEKRETCTTLGPENCSLRVRVAISDDGIFQIGTLGEDLNEHLLVLAVSQGLNNYHKFGGGMLEPDEVGQPHEFRIDLDERQCLIAAWLRELYVYLDKNDAVSHGPEHNGDLYRCPIRLKNRLPQPITVLQAYLHHQQTTYTGYPPNQRLVDEQINATWSPIAKEPTQQDGAHLEFSFDLKCTPDVPSALHLRAYADNDNASSFKVFGLSLHDLPWQVREGTYASIELDAAAGTCQGNNPLVEEEVVVGTARAILYDQAPTRVELTVDTTWSVSSPFVRYATLGDVQILGAEWSPTGLAERELRPQIWVLPPESD